MTPVLQGVHRVIPRHLLGQSGLKPDEAGSGAVTQILRFGLATNLDIPLHCLVLDGVYRRGADDTPAFVEASALIDEALQTVLHKIHHPHDASCSPVVGVGRRARFDLQGRQQADNDGDSDAAPVLKPLQAAARTYRVAFGPRAGQRVLTVQGAMRREKAEGIQADAVRWRRRFQPARSRAAALTTGTHRSNCAAASPARRWPTSACGPSPPDRWC